MSRRRGRIIPARAGFTLDLVGTIDLSGDHPRSRGVYRRSPASGHARSGSSPLARGLRTIPSAGARRVGIIPARAGFTAILMLDARRVTDHPRSRGVYFVSGRNSRHQVRIIPARAGFTHPEEILGREDCGSSPLARGLQNPGPGWTSAPRIIPARAGFTCTSTCGKCRSRDHPRSRGVYDEVMLIAASMCGSSPLARGLQLSPVVAEPAYSDHPRSRGVYLTSPRVGVWEPGSSPLARGLPPPPLTQNTPSRIIPARAGFTSLMCFEMKSFTDHPRSRGVYLLFEVADPLRQGSSPLARGLHCTSCCTGYEEGIIPARAGFTGRPR